MATSESELRAIYEIPVDSSQADFKFRTDLEGTTYVLRMYWNTREERWHIDFLDADENPLLMGVPLVTDTDVMGRFEIPGLMKGIVMLYDTGEKFVEATRDSFGDRSKLLYQESTTT